MTWSIENWGSADRVFLNSHVEGKRIPILNGSKKSKIKHSSPNPLQQVGVWVSWEIAGASFRNITLVVSFPSTSGKRNRNCSSRMLDSQSGWHARTDDQQAFE